MEQPNGEEDNPSDENVACCLDKEEDKKALASLYHFLRDLTITNVNIDVSVCGVKNLLVQNEESLQDVNNPFFPFGTRPKVGAEFYIGSKEVFCKNWSSFFVKVQWKDRPENFAELYEDYHDGAGNPLNIMESSFKANTAILRDGVWTEDGEKTLFADKEYSVCEPVIPDSNIAYNGYQFNSSDFSVEFKSKPFTSEPLEALGVNSRDGFFKMTLAGVGFQHDRFPYVLARKLIILAGLIDPNDLETLKDTWFLLKNRIDNLGIPAPNPGLVTDLQAAIISLGSIRMNIDDVIDDVGGLQADLNTADRANRSSYSNCETTLKV